jgi:uncharacterized membrane protein
MDGLALGCVGSLVAVVIFGLTVVLPVVTAVRLHRVMASVNSLRSTVRDLETRLVAANRALSVAPPLAEPAAAVAAPATRPAAAPLESPRVDPGTREDAGPRPTSLAPQAEIPAMAVVVPAQADTLESQIGGRWLLFFGASAFVFGIGFFVKYAFDNQWITETARVVLGAVLGIAMVAAGRRFVAHGYQLYGQVVAGSGFVAMYVSTWAALNLYELVSRPVAFALMVVITAAAAVMADQLASQALAFVAVLGGFVTPALVGGRVDAQVVLFTYVTVLVAGTMYLAARRQWPWLNLASYILTLFTFFGWATTHYTAAKYPPTQFFLVVLGAMFGWVYWQEFRRQEVRHNPTPAIVLGSVVLFFHVASVANLADHSLPLLVYVIALTLAGVMLSVRADRAWIRLATFIGVTPVFLGWFDNHTSRSWLAAGVVVVVAQYAMYLTAVWERIVRQPDPWPREDLVLFHANALAFFAGLYIVADAHWPYSTPLLALGLALWQGALAWRLRAQSDEAAVNGLAAAFAMVGFAIGIQFDDWWALVGWAMEAGAIYWAGLRTGRAWMRLGGGLLLVAVLARLSTMDFFGTPAGFVAVWNPRAGATLLVVAVIYGMSFFYRRFNGADTARRAAEYAALLVGANILTVLVGSVEINSYWHLRSTDDAAASFALLASLSLAWGLYGTALVVAGLLRRYAPLRYLAIALLLVTVAKVFLIDLSELGGGYRVVGFMGLGVFLLFGAWLYQRYRDVILGPRP